MLEYFLHLTPWPCKKGVHLKGWDLRCHPTPGGKYLELARRNHSNMANAPSSSSHPHGSKKGDWGSCSVSHDQLVKLQMQGFLPPADLEPCSGRIDLLLWRSPGGKFPQSNQGERVCFVSFLLRGIGFPIHPFLRGLLEYYGLQLHNPTPSSILHIAGYVALCELFLGCKAHFEL